MHRVEAFGLRARQVHHARGNDLQYAASKRERIRPIAFFATASGLMMEKVRSTAMPGSPMKLLNNRKV
jgi:hypothetical protein